MSHSASSFPSNPSVSSNVTLTLLPLLSPYSMSPLPFFLSSSFLPRLPSPYCGQDRAHHISHQRYRPHPTSLCSCPCSLASSFLHRSHCTICLHSPSPTMGPSSSRVSLTGGMPSPVVITSVPLFTLLSGPHSSTNHPGHPIPLN